MKKAKDVKLCPITKKMRKGRNAVSTFSLHLACVCIAAAATKKVEELRTTSTIDNDDEKIE